MLSRRWELYQDHAEFDDVLRKLDTNLQKYRADFKEAQTAMLQLPLRYGGYRYWDDLIIVAQGRSERPEHWPLQKRHDRPDRSAPPPLLRNTLRLI